MTVFNLFESRFVKTDVTSLKIFKSFFFIGCGRHLCIYNRKTYNLIARQEIFHGIKIHGIEISTSGNNLLLYGRDLLKIYELNSHIINDKEEIKNLKENASASNSSWILSAKWLEHDQKIATIVTENKVYLWKSDLSVFTQVVCEEKCLLYSGCLVYEKWNNLVALSGTVFSEVLIWKPAACSSNQTSSVLRKLKGHKGVIFSLDYNPKCNFICSTSDDRSAILWKIGNQDLSDELLHLESTIEPKCKVYGHSSRIFRCKVLEDQFITGGEDGLLNIWNFNSTLYKKIETQQGSQVWALDVDEVKKLIMTGGADGSVTVFPYQNNLLEKVVQVPGSEVPMKAVLLSNDNILTITYQGNLFLYCTSNENWLKLNTLDDLKSYALLEVSRCRNIVSLSGFCGQIHIYRQIGGDFQHTCSSVLDYADRIFAFHWLTCNLFLVCQSQGKLILCEIKSSEIIPLYNFLLPPSKERWSTTACLGPCDTVIVGDRRGSIHVFKVGHATAVQTIWKAHSHLGVTDVTYRDFKLTSLGRNAVIKEYAYNNEKHHFYLLTSDKTPITWLTSKHDDTIAAFCSNNFVLWDAKSRRTTWEHNCGGGHRSFDFKMAVHFSFIYLKGKSVYQIAGNWDNIAPVDVIPGFHIKEINTLGVINLKNDIITITGGEDTTLRISAVPKHTKDASLHTIANRKSHLSSIKSIFVHKLNDNKYLIFSAGGRAQLILWFLSFPNEDATARGLYCAEHSVFHEELEQEESEMRIMDLLCTDIQSDLKLFAACSDGYIKVFTVSQGQNGTYHLQFDQNIFYKLKCILTVNVIKLKDSNILVTTATDGLITFWYIESSENVLHYKVLSILEIHQSGINSLQYIMQDNLCHIVTGGDDNAVVLTTVRLKPVSGGICIERVADWMDTVTHCTQITGVFICDKYFITSAVDQRMAIFEWKYHKGKLLCKLVNVYRSPITDVQGMHCFFENDCFNVLIHGRGLEFLQIIKNSK